MVRHRADPVPGELAEIRVPALHGAKPGILQLLVTPERGQFVDAVPEHIAAAPGRSGKIEQRPVGVEDAGLHADQRSLLHARHLTREQSWNSKRKKWPCSLTAPISTPPPSRSVSISTTSVCCASFTRATISCAHSITSP